MELELKKSKITFTSLSNQHKDLMDERKKLESEQK